MVHILVYIHAATVPQTASYFYAVILIGYIWGRGDPGSIIYTSWGPAMGGMSINQLN
jgi:hypothetical protein